ncbi:unnamed protein product [Cyprideis torosa]|uniref:Uncharacterized protein n=1 Tax=Cyprideis torosa TaxID=163714 RepID=A0A7R8WGE4_9CRUS|nr:unnamed protein product [Cyprideis torosa]CAG0897976.1 unnamed protein product [Cyprideis torosa]
MLSAAHPNQCVQRKQKGADSTSYVSFVTTVIDVECSASESSEARTRMGVGTVPKTVSEEEVVVGGGGLTSPPPTIGSALDGVVGGVIKSTTITGGGEGGTPIGGGEWGITITGGEG